MGSAEKLPDGWIRKESRSRPNQFYYFNTKTGKTQWSPPTNAKSSSNERQTRDNSAKSTKSDANSEGSSRGQSRFKISDKTKDGKFHIILALLITILVLIFANVVKMCQFFSIR